MEVMKRMKIKWDLVYKFKKTIHQEVLNDLNKIIEEEKIYYNPINQDISNNDDSRILIKVRNNEIQEIKNNINDKMKFERSKVIIHIMRRICKDGRFMINGDFIFNLHDSADKDNINEIVMSKNKNTQKTIIPDLYALECYNGRLNSIDKNLFKNKIKKGYFVGSSTGNLDPIKNNRLQICSYIHNIPIEKRNYVSKINNVCQIDPKEIKKIYNNLEDFVIKENVSMREQRRYRYIINIDGNSTGWDRMVWIFKGNSICLKQRSDNICWYYKLLENNKHYYEFDTPEDLNNLIEELNQKYEINQTEIENMMIESKKFLLKYLDPYIQITYMGLLLENISKKNLKNK